MIDLTGRTAVITGSGRNLGLAIAAEMVGLGANVVVAENDRGRGSAAVEYLDSISRGSAAFAYCDVGSEGSVIKMVESARGEFGRLDVLVNNVAISDRGNTILDEPIDVWRAVINTTLTSAYLCTKHAGKAMVEHGNGGAIVNIGSTSAHVGRHNALAYGVAKAGLLSLTRSTAVQLGPYGIRVNTVSPNKVGSPVGESEENADRIRNNALGRAANLEEVARAVVFLASDSAGFVTGTELMVDGGASIRST